MASTKKKNTKKKEEDNKNASSASKKTSASKTSSEGNKKNSGAKKGTSAKKSTSPKNTTKKKTNTGKKSKSSTADKSNKVKVRVTHEDISGIEEDMEEKTSSAGKGKSAVSSSGAGKKKGASRSSSVQKKKEKESEDTGQKKKEQKEVKEKTSVESDKNREEKGSAEEVKESARDKIKEWKSFAINDPKEEQKKKNKKEKPRSIGLYKKIAFTFILLTLLLVGAVAYFSVVHVTITLTPKKNRVSDNLIVNVYDQRETQKSDLSSKTITGVVDKLNIKKSATYKSTGERVIGEEITGEVKIVNNYSQAQPLVASTRLLSPNDKLYRIEKTVRVAPGETVSVGVYTEDPGPEMAIGPTEFTIPGLWAGLQDDIYAKSEKGFEYETQKEYFVREYDINNAVRDIKKKLSRQAKNKFGDSYLGYEEVVYKEDNMNVEVGAEVGEVTKEFQVNAKGGINVVAFDINKLKEMARSKLSSVISSDRKLVGFHEKNMSYSLNSYNTNENKATLKVEFSGKTSLKGNTDIVEKKRLTGLSKDQLKDYLDGLENISDYKIEFFPSFVESVPSLADRIEVKVK